MLLKDKQQHGSGRFVITPEGAAYLLEQNAGVEGVQQEIEEIEKLEMTKPQICALFGAEAFEVHDINAVRLFKRRPPTDKRSVPKIVLQALNKDIDKKRTTIKINGKAVKLAVSIHVMEVDEGITVKEADEFSITKGELLALLREFLD